LPHLKSPLIGPKLLAVIKRNSFFEFNPKQAIKATSTFFRNKSHNYLLLENPDTESTILRILECIQVDSQVAQELITKTLKTEDFCFILTFLESYNFLKARRISQQELTSFIKQKLLALFIVGATAYKVGLAKATPNLSAITCYNSAPVALTNNSSQPVKIVDNTHKNEERLEKRSQLIISQKKLLNQGL
jgi:hypothetical protein